jgi:hypothetical protein
MDMSALREEFLKLVVEQNDHHFHSVFGASCTDPTAEIPLPGLHPQPPSDLMAQVQRAFREGELYDAAAAQTILTKIVPDAADFFGRLVGLRCFKVEADGKFRWCLPNSQTPPPLPSRPKPPQDHLKTSPEERAALVAKCMPKGRLEKFPLKEKARLAVVEHISSLFQPGTIYTEKQVDQILKAVADDHTKARRYLIDYQYLHRKNDGSAYWTWDSPPPEHSPR